MASTEPRRARRCAGCHNRADPGPASVRDEPDAGWSTASASTTTSSRRAAIGHEPGTRCPAIAGCTTFGHEPDTDAECDQPGSTGKPRTSGTDCFASLGHKPGTSWFRPAGHSTGRAAVRDQPGTSRLRPAGCTPLGHEPGTGAGRDQPRTRWTCPAGCTTAGIGFTAPLGHQPGTDSYAPAGRITAGTCRLCSGSASFTAPLGHKLGTGARYCSVRYATISRGSAAASPGVTGPGTSCSTPSNAAVCTASLGLCASPCRSAVGPPGADRAISCCSTTGSTDVHAGCATAAYASIGSRAGSRHPTTGICTGCPSTR